MPVLGALSGRDSAVSMRLDEGVKARATLWKICLMHIIAAGEGLKGIGIVFAPIEPRMGSICPSRGQRGFGPTRRAWDLRTGDYLGTLTR